MRTIIGLAVVTLAFTLPACVGGGGGNGGSGSSDTTASTDVGPAEDSGTVQEGSVTGTVVDESGAGVEGVMILACDDDSCITAKTDGSGSYNITLPFGWRKMQMMGAAKGFMSLNYYQNVEGTEPTVAASDIVAVPMSTEPPAALPAAEGGTVVLAAGELTITAGAGVAVYPIGQVEEVTAVKLSAAHLPPYDMDAPWAGKEDQTIAFHINPLPVKAASEDQAFNFSVTGGSGDYKVYYVDDHYGTLHEGVVGGVDGDGTISGTVPVLTTLVLVPAG